jgi:hypothetical protein
LSGAGIMCEWGVNCCVSAYPSAMPRLEASVNEVSAV